MTTLVLETESVEVPHFADLRAFRRWARSDRHPETGKFCYLDGSFWMDMSKEQFFSHNQVKSEYNIVLGGFTKRERLGRYVPDGMLLTNVIANLSCQPDGAFISLESLRDGLVKLANGKKDGCLEIVGRPDMVLEVVSDGSVKKDLETLRDLYWRAGINEYWIVDARGERLMFEILRRNGTGYVSSRKKAGWVFSEVFGRSFKLIRQTDELGDLEFILEVK